MMRKFWTILSALILLLGPLAGFTSAQITAPSASWSFRVSVVDENLAQVTTGRCRILTASTYNTDAPTIYTDSALSTAATTLTAAGWAPTMALDSTGSCIWYAATGTNSFDVIVYIDSGQYGGRVARVDGVTRTNAKRIILTHPQGLKHYVIPFLQNASTQTSTIKLPGGMIVTGAVLEVVTAVAASTVNVGYAGGAVTTFCSAQSSASAGYAVCSTTLTTAVGTAASALQYSTSAHAVAGFAHVYGYSAGD